MKHYIQKYSFLSVPVFHLVILGTLALGAYQTTFGKIALCD